MFATSHIEIDRSALIHNLHFLKDYFGENVLFSSVVKGNAYGHGIDLFVPMAESCGVDHFSVFSADEALRLSRVSSGRSRVLIMGGIENTEIEWAIVNGIEFFVFDPDRLEHALAMAKKTGIPAKVHLEVETGMNRTGLEQQEIDTAVQMLRDNPIHLSLEGLCTHYAGAESIANYYRIKEQRATFKKIVGRFNRNELRPRCLHTACSAAAMRYPPTRMDMVRIGILQYGFFPSQEVLIEYLTGVEEKVYPLHRVLSWKSKVMDIKSVRRGEFIGYGTSYLANVDMKIAIVPVGYSHGFSRSLSNQGRVLIRGKRLSVVGMVNMSMIAVDATNVPEAEKGDEVVIIGRQGDLEISVSSFGKYSDQVNYELLTRLPGDIPRRVHN